MVHIYSSRVFKRLQRTTGPHCPDLYTVDIQSITTVYKKYISIRTVSGYSQKTTVSVG